jgi:hypothetical protein
VQVAVGRVHYVALYGRVLVVVQRLRELYAALDRQLACI